MNVDDLIEALRLTGLHGVEVVIDSTMVDTRDAEEQLTPDKPPPLNDTYPVVSVVGAAHDSPVVISARWIEVPPPPPQAPIDPGYPGQLSPPPPEFVGS